MKTQGRSGGTQTIANKCSQVKQLRVKSHPREVGELEFDTLGAKRAFELIDLTCLAPDAP